MSNFFRRLFKVLKWATIAIIALVLLILVCINLQFVHNYALNKSIAYFNAKTGGELSVSQIDLKLPRYVQLQGVELKDPNGISLLSAEDIEIELSWHYLFDHKIELDYVKLQSLTSGVQSDKAGIWNYDFIIDGFSSEDTSAAIASDSEPWDFGIDQIEIIDNIVHYIDRTKGDSIGLKIGNMEIEMEAFSILRNTYIADEIALNNTHGTIQIGERNEAEEVVKSDEGESTELIVGLTSLHLNENELRYQSSSSADYYDFKIGEIALEMNHFEMDSLTINIESLDVSNSKFAGLITPTEAHTESSTNVFAPIFLDAKEINIAEFEVNIANGNPDEDLNISNLNLNISRLAATPTSYRIDLQKGSVNFNNQIQVQELALKTRLTDKSIEIDALQLNTHNSRISAHGGLSFINMDSLMLSRQFQNLAFDIQELEIDPALIAVFVPDSIFSIEKELSLSARIKGHSTDLRAENINLRYGSTQIDFIGNIIGKDWNQINYHIENLQADIHRSDLQGMLTANDIDTTYIPSHIQFDLNGIYSNKVTHLVGDIVSPFGELAIGINAEDTNNFEQITIDLKSALLDAGAYLKLADPLKFGVNSKVHLNLADSLPAAEGFVHFKELAYSNTKLSELDIVFKGAKGEYAFETNSVDSFLIADLCGEIAIDTTVSLYMEGEVAGMNLAGLGITTYDLRSALSLSANYTQSNRHQSGDFSVNDIIFIRNGVKGAIDPLTGSFYFSDDSTVAALDNSSIRFKSKSNRSPQELSVAIADVIEAGAETIEDSTAFWNAEFNITDLPQIREILFPELKEFETAIGTVDFSAANRMISADIEIPAIVYNKFHVNDLTFKANGSAENIESNLYINRFSIDTVGVNDINLSTKSSLGNTEIQLLIDSDTLEARYQILAKLEADSVSLAKGFKVNFIEPFVLNHEPWKIDSLNRVHYDGNGFNVDQFNINRETDSLSISKNKQEETISIRASSFDLTSIIGIFDLPSPLARGKLYGDLEFHKNGSFSGDGYIEAFELAHAQLGVFKWKADSDLDYYDIAVSADGSDVQFEAKGEIVSKHVDLANLDFNINLKKLDMGAAQKIFPNKLKHGSGIIKGDIKLSGSNIKPVAIGQLQMDDVEIGLAVNGGIYKVKNQTIELGANFIGFNQFAVTDSSDHGLVVNGRISHNHFQHFETNLEIQTEDFSILDLNQSESHMLFGKLLADSKIKVKGKLEFPQIDAKIKISEKTDLTYVVPERNYEVRNDDDLLQWTDFQSSIETNALLGSSDSKAKKQYIHKAIELSGAFDIDENAIFRVVIDSTAGDFVEIKGGGKIGVSYDRAGNLRMNGVYKVTDGFYKMTFYDIVKRTFDFQPGSSITWNGDIMDATIDITAIYKTRANVANLMASDGSDNAVKSFQEQLPFDVKMKMAGDLTRPEISFSIDLDESRRGVYGGAVEAKLNELRQNENELNKQVFALLVLNTFMTTNTSADQNLAANQARNSASQILSQQLNSLSDQYISGVDLNFDLQSYGGVAGEGNTDLNIDLAKTFLDDRMVVRVGSTIALESNNTNASDEQTVMTNIAIEYKLTPDGRYRFKVYQKTDMEDIVVGKITRTGAGILFQRDFDRIEQLFKSENKDLDEGVNPAIKKATDK